MVQLDVVTELAPVPVDVGRTAVLIEIVVAEAGIDGKMDAVAPVPCRYRRLNCSNWLPSCGSATCPPPSSVMSPPITTPRGAAIGCPAPPSPLGVPAISRGQKYS